MQAPVFIVGVNGSGTTMLADALGKHPDLYMLPTESRVLAYFAGRYPVDSMHDPASRRALADEMGASRAFRHANGKQPLRLENAEELAPDFAAVVGEVYMTLARAQGKQRWGDKSPMYLQHLALLAERFPDARFVHIHRDARDSAQSFHRRWRQEPRRMVYRWKQAIRMGHEQGRRLGPERYLEVAYEALTTDAETGMRSICEFLDLPFHPAVLESNMRWMDDRTRDAARGRFVENSGRWRRYFTVEQVDALERIAGQMLNELGYETARQGNENPSRLQRLIWKWLDHAHSVRIHVAKHGLKGLPALKLRIQDGMRQDRVNKY